VGGALKRQTPTTRPLLKLSSIGAETLESRKAKLAKLLRNAGLGLR
jgi:hypothetical protein